MTQTERQALKNHFWTAQLIGGLAMAAKMLVDTGIVGAIAGFVAVMPIAALAAWIKVLFERRWPPSPTPPKTRWGRATLVGIGISAALIGALFLLSG